MTQKKFDDFDGFADNYREIHNESLKISGTDSDYFSEHKIIEIKKIERRNNISMLDLGCGDGNSAEFFHKHFENCKYFGLEVSKESIKIASGKNIPSSEFLPYNGFDIPFEDNCFDIVFIACVLHHVNFKFHAKILEEVKRVLKKGGNLFIFEHNPYNPITKKIVKSCPFDKDAVLLFPSYTSEILSQLNYENISINFTIFFPRNRLFEKLIFLENYFKKIPLGGQYYAVASKNG
jgi:ubiquinone/menaquinone biosynthesis C-methylase UbiE